MVDKATNSNIFSEYFILNLPITIRWRGRVGLVTALRTGKQNYLGSILPVAQTYLFFRTPIPALESTKPPIQFTLHVITFYTHFPSQKCVQLQLQFSPTSLGAFAKFQKATISYVMSVCPSIRLSVCPSVRLSICSSVLMEQFGYHWTDIHETFIYEYFFENLSEKFKFH